jgi:GNAT superfamily N-acetyltransferase
MTTSLPQSREFPAPQGARFAVEADLDRLAQVWFNGWHQAHDALLPPDMVRQRTLTSFQRRLPALLPDTRVVGPVGAPLGFCVVRGDELHQLFVSAETYGSGVAAALLTDGERRIAQRNLPVAWLTCVLGNQRATRFFDKHGWRFSCVIRDVEVTEAGTFPIDVCRYYKSVMYPQPPLP